MGCCLSNCCGYPLTLSRKKLKDREVYINRHLDECPKTHIIYHEVLYPYVLEQIRAFGTEYEAEEGEFTDLLVCGCSGVMPEVLREVVEQIEDHSNTMETQVILVYKYV